MQDRHSDRRRYFNEQAYTTKKYVIPYISAVKPITADMRILEIGCGEGGNMLPFAEMGCEVIGVDLNQTQLERARLYLDEKGQKSVQLINKNVYHVEDELGEFDVIFLRDVIEHIPDQERFMTYVKKFMKSDGVIFFGFPPWQMPFGGHQQAIRNKVFSKIPYTHLLPRRMYASLMKMWKVTPVVIDSRLEIWDTGISIELIEKYLKNAKLAIVSKTLYLINPNYEVKFGMKPVRQSILLRNIPYLRNYFTTCGYYVVKIIE